MIKFFIYLGLFMLALPVLAERDHGVVIPGHVTVDAIPVCYDFGCKTRTVVNLPLTDWKSVADWFAVAAETAEQERTQIAKAIGWMEVVIGRHTPTHIDLEFDKAHDIDNRETGQLDCIDESVNTTVYLQLFETYGLLKHHIVIEEAYRKAAFDQHWAGQVRDIKSGKRYVVDSWFQPNGYLPVIQDGEDWENITMLSAVVDNRPDETGNKVKRSFWHRLLRGD